MPGRRFDDFVGIVCGTGFNASYVEQQRAIGKLSGLDPAGSQVINTESGSFGLTPTGRVDEAYDATTATPAKYLHEKMISGAYLGGLGALFTLKQAARPAVFPRRTSRGTPGRARAFYPGAQRLPPAAGDGGNPLGSLCQTAAGRVTGRACCAFSMHSWSARPSWWR